MDLWRDINRAARAGIFVLGAWLMVSFLLPVAGVGSSGTAIVTLLFPFVAVLIAIRLISPLAIAAVSVFGGAFVFRWIAGILGALLLVGAYVTYVPVRDNPSLLPLAALAIATIVFLSLGFACHGWARGVNFVLFLVFLALTAAIFFPHKAEQVRGKVRAWEESDRILPDLPKSAPTAAPASFPAERRQEYRLEPGQSVNIDIPPYHAFRLIEEGDSLKVVDLEGRVMGPGVKWMGDDILNAHFTVSNEGDREAKVTLLLRRR